MNQRTLVIILFAILLAVTLAGVAVLSILPSDDNDLARPVTTDSDETTQPPAGGSTRVEAFDVRVFERAGYTTLNLLPLQNGSLPVLPPAGTGKANPFL